MFAAIHLPAFSLQAVLRWREELWMRSVAVVDPESGLVVERTRPAAAQGVEQGMTASQAMARSQELEVISRSAMQERTIDAVLIESALRHSPFVEHTAPGLVTLDLHGTFPKVGWHTFGDGIVAHLQSVGLRAGVAIGKNPDVARLAAREADPVSIVRDTGGFLHPLPVSFLGASEELLAILHDWGIATIGQFLALPVQETVERLGPESRKMWLMASGRSRRPLRLVRSPETFEESCDLGYAVETSEPLLFLLRRFVEQLSGRLQAVGLVVTRMTLCLPLDNRSTHEHVFSIPEPTAAADVLFRILSTHLETLKLAEKPVGVALRVEPSVPSRQQFGLFGTALRDPNRFGETLARIGALVGADHAGFAKIENTHRVDDLRMVERVSWTLEETSLPHPVRLGLPLRRCRPPVSAQVELKRRCPARVVSTLVSGAVSEAQGPYRISGHWWEGGMWHSEEWDVAFSQGGLYRVAKSAGAWRIEGCYDSIC